MSIQSQIEKLEAELASLREEQRVEQENKREEGLRRLSDVTQNLSDALNRGQEIAEEYGITWSPDLPYGMGGDYYPKSKADSYYGAGWQASSHSC